jgi:hypothetical protein
LKVIVLGGAGAMAQFIIRDLLESPNVETIGVAGDGYDFVRRVVSKPGRARRSQRSPMPEILEG